MNKTTVIATIFTKNYLSYVRVLHQSVLKYHPEVKFVALLVDRPEGKFDPGAEKFEIRQAEEIGVQNFCARAFQYLLVELCTSLKPDFLKYLFDHNPTITNVIYLDPDMVVLEDISLLEKKLERRSILLTPHNTQPYPDSCRPSEKDLLRYGIFNLGFLALSRCPQTMKLLQWWSERLENRCLADPSEGLFVDQKWMDLVPAFFDEAEILRSSGINVAHWNLHERNGEDPIRIFHFSGFLPGYANLVSRHQNRYTLEDLGEALAWLFTWYGAELKLQGHDRSRFWPYSFAKFHHGPRIPQLCRRAYLTLGEKQAQFGDPFEALSPLSFYRWWRELRGPNEVEGQDAIERAFYLSAQHRQLRVRDRETQFHPESFRPFAETEDENNPT